MFRNIALAGGGKFGVFLLKKLQRVLFVICWVLFFTFLLINFVSSLPSFRNHGSNIKTSPQDKTQIQDDVKYFHVSGGQNWNDSRQLLSLLNYRVHLYSAIAYNSTEDSFYDVIHLSGWENRPWAIEQTPNYTCCLLYSYDGSYSVIGTRLRARHDWSYVGKAKLEVKQFLCGNVLNARGLSPAAVSLGIDRKCPKDFSQYIKVDYPRQQPDESVGVCAKLIYGTIDPSVLVEWFEYQRYMGVSKVISFTQNLSQEAMSVLEYYRKEGLGENNPFELPMIDGSKRYVGVKNFQGWNDEQVTVYDCQGKLSGYKYIALYDVDEYLFPTFVTDFVSLMNDEHYLSEDKQFYNIFLSVRIPHVSTCCKKAEICVNIKPTNKLAPRWLSSPTKQGPMELEDNIIHPRMKGNTVSKMVTLLHPPRLSASQNSVGNGEFVFLKLQNTTSRPVRLDECLVHPDSCPKGLPGSQLCSSTVKKGGVCESHRNMMSVLASDTAIMPVMLWPGECAAFCYSINVSVCEQSYTKEDIAVVATLKWTAPSFQGNEDASSLTTVYRVHNVKLRRGLFVVSAACEEKSVKKGKSFTVTYTIHNALQDFLSVKLHWKPAIQGECNEVSRRNFEKLENHLICEDPCIQLGVCQYGDVVQAKISFCALSTGLYEVCKHLKINLRYLIPGSDNTSLASPASLCSSVSDDHFGLSTEYPLRPRSESGSSFSDTHHYTTEEKRLSNKSFNFGDLQDRSPSETELFVKPRPDKSPVLPRRDPKLGMMSAAKYEQMLLSPGNFIKNSCLVRVE